MKVPRDLSGAQLVKVLCREWNYRVVHQEGSHIILQTDMPTHQRLSVANHNPLRIGTLNNIIRAIRAHKSVGARAVAGQFVLMQVSGLLRLIASVLPSSKTLTY